MNQKINEKWWESTKPLQQPQPLISRNHRSRDYPCYECVTAIREKKFSYKLCDRCVESINNFLAIQNETNS